MSSQHFIPPVNFGMIEEDLYRSGQPNELNFPFLEKLGLKTIAWLALEEPNQRFLILLTTKVYSYIILV
ncbi:unnamed protein product [Rhizopus microsporus]